MTGTGSGARAEYARRASTPWRGTRAVRKVPVTIGGDMTNATRQRKTLDRMSVCELETGTQWRAAVRDDLAEALSAGGWPMGSRPGAHSDMSRSISLLWHALAEPGPKTPGQLANIHQLSTVCVARPEVRHNSVGGAQRNGPDSTPPLLADPGQTFTGPDAA